MALVEALPKARAKYIVTKRSKSKARRVCIHEGGQPPKTKKIVVTEVTFTKLRNIEVAYQISRIFTAVSIVMESNYC